MSAKPKIGMNLNAWSYADYIAFAEAMRTMDLNMAFKLAENIILHWSYPEPFKAGALRSLNVLQSMEVLRAVLDTLNVHAQDIDTSDVVLDLSKWSLERFLKFNDLREKGNSAQVMSMVREVAIVDGLAEKDEPTMIQGVLMVKAVSDAIGAVLTAKN